MRGVEYDKLHSYSLKFESSFETNTFSKDEELNVGRDQSINMLALS